VFLKCSTRRKDGKTHRSWSIVESHRCSDGRVAQRHVLYLGEINDSQRLAWEKSIAVFDQERGHQRQIALFPEDRKPDPGGAEALSLRLDQLRLENPRQWGACWLGDQLWQTLNLDRFFGSRLGVNARLVQDDTLYRSLDRLLEHKEALFSHLRQRWDELFKVRFEVLLYDLTRTYFECEAPEDPLDPRRFGYSRDRRGDCVQVVVALVVTPDGFPLAYEMFPGNTADKTTLKEMLQTIQGRHGRADRIWVMDRGIPTEEILTELRSQTDVPVRYLVGTPKGRLGRCEAELAGLPWQEVRSRVRVKLLPKDGEVYVLAQSQDRTSKEQAMRRRKLKAYWKRLKELQAQQPDRDLLLRKLGGAEQKAGKITKMVQVRIFPQGGLEFTLDRKRLKEVRNREGRYLLRTNLGSEDPARIWQAYMQLSQVEEAFRTLKAI